jgi:hypothetical protein
MGPMTIEGVVENGQIRLKEETDLPEGTPVLVVIPSVKIIGRGHIYSPHLAHPEDAEVFKVEIEEHGD